MNGLDNFLINKLDDRKSKGLMRALPTFASPDIDFTSNDYLGLARSEELFNVIAQRSIHAQKKSNGSTGSRLLSGNSNLIEETESRLANLFNSESTLIFNSGYAANLAVLSSLPQRSDTIFLDEHAHACMKDGARLSLAKRVGFRHNNLNDLESKLRQATGQIYIAVESIYSMDGDVCPLKDLIYLAEKYDGTIILDEAHSTGVLGPNGAGLAVSLGLEQKIGIRIYTFGKAMGVHGACVAGSKLLQQYLTNFARSFIYTTAPSPHSVVAIASAFDYLAQHQYLQEKLRSIVNEFVSLMKDHPRRTPSYSAIQGIIFAGNENVRMTASNLRRKGFDVRPIVYPTVKTGQERIRICLHSFNSIQEINDLVHNLNLINNKQA
ncbi:MAG: 8-amino-7-oxononanoate synthase [Chryseolinea sp.]